MSRTLNIDENDIVNDYKNNIGIVGICNKYHIGKLRVKEILKRNNVEIRKGGNISIKHNFIVPDWRIEKYPEEEGYHYVAIFRENGTEFKDVKNQGGHLSEYIRKMTGIIMPTLYERRKYYQETGNYWFEQWFDIVKRKNPDVKKCPYCNWTTIDIENRSGAFEVHLREKHNITKEEYLKEFPDELGYFSLVNETKNLQFSTNEKEFVKCEICGKKLRRIDIRHLKKHETNIDEYRQKYNKTVSDELHLILSENAINANINMKPKFFTKPELEIMDFIKKYGFECYKDRKILKGKELDIFIPSKQIAIEYNGNFYHTEEGGGKGPKHHLSKTLMCKENGVKLIQIFEDEYMERRDIVFNKIKHILNLKDDNENIIKIAGRKCVIKRINNKMSEDFLEKYHIQGFVSSTLYYGAFYNDELIAVMNFKKLGKNFEDEWELTRFASNYNYICQGVGGKLLKAFISENNPILIKSFADRRWTIDEDSNVYIKLGFNFEGYTRPDYKYYNCRINRFTRYHKFGFRKHILMRKYPNAGLTNEMTETEMTKKLGYDKIWDCGLIKYVWRKEE